MVIAKLRSWAYNSLDLYKIKNKLIHSQRSKQQEDSDGNKRTKKQEESKNKERRKEFINIHNILHPSRPWTFLHTFCEDHDLMHLRDLQKLEGVLSPQHLEEMELALSLRQSKVNIKLCEVLDCPKSSSLFSMKMFLGKLAYCGHNLVCLTI
ncbi:transcription initiation factor TFIID subunit 5-like [Dioscorea cayenensis subsp. rotundata]|uniref:Transcription initiation factor TFIID subunit 5-like n=1 Tax=Dioscorea cayennensis subsp. rotundata TaxID=55577 RepID=A0AB40BX62_DIOCR|nr:transcription initiation factor TFIID subunit 5-like [Dioscorea cayenensis subsp. rotundata]